jgi:hypothetical protein
MAKNDGILKVVGGAFAAFGLLALSVGVWCGKSQVDVIKTWPETRATVVDSHLNSEITHDMDRPASRRDIVMYRTAITFRYTVSGREYVTPAPSNYSSSNYQEMKRKADAFPAGSVRTVKYNPADPKEISHNAAYTWSYFFIPVMFGGMGLLLTFIGTVFLLVHMRTRSPRCARCGKPIGSGQNFCGYCAAPAVVTR